MIVITMENGKQMKFRLRPDCAPISCENFEKLVKEGFYNGLTFHRVISGFMIQAAVRTEPAWAVRAGTSRASSSQTV